MSSFQAEKSPSKAKGYEPMFNHHPNTFYLILERKPLPRFLAFQGKEPSVFAWEMNQDD